MKAPHSPSSDPGFRNLLRRARRGDHQALGQLIDRYRPYLLTVANEEGDSDLQAKLGASDVVQSACVDALQGFRNFRGRSSREMLNWLRQIVIFRLHGVRDEFQAGKRDIAAEAPRHAGGHSFDHLQSPVTPPGEAVVRNEERESLECALADLPDQDRLIIEMRHKEGLAFAAIARQIFMSEDAVRKRWSRAIQVLQKKVQ